MNLSASLPLAEANGTGFIANGALAKFAALFHHLLQNKERNKTTNPKTVIANDSEAISACAKAMPVCSVIKSQF